MRSRGGGMRRGRRHVRRWRRHVRRRHRVGVRDCGDRSAICSHALPRTGSRAAMPASCDRGWPRAPGFGVTHGRAAFEATGLLAWTTAPNGLSLHRRPPSRWSARDASPPFAVLGPPRDRRHRWTGPPGRGRGASPTVAVLATPVRIGPVPPVIDRFAIHEDEARRIERDACLPRRPESAVPRPVVASPIPVAPDPQVAVSR